MKLPSDYLEQEAARTVYEQYAIPRSTLAERVRHVVQSAFDGRRIVIFSGGAINNDTDALLAEARAIREGGGFGSIMGRNTFQREREASQLLLGAIIDIFK
ncbi:MAG TPA: hypothetical protein VIL85_01155 [Thermomicrobiales bacterium]